MDDRRDKFIDSHRGLFWYTPEASLHEISDELLVESTLNYGTLDDYRELKSIMSPQRMAKVFFSATDRKSGNYFPEIRHFFTLALRQYA